MSRLPPAEKLPLAVRKNSRYLPYTSRDGITNKTPVRDSWENTKEDHKKKLSEILGQPWTINIDPKALYPYAEEGSWGHTSMGDLIVKFVSL
ncbi:hypothetical protein LB505_000768 [Fusarium chuoi]|nr:hypothetical protein LB505_000768 [Fusarium chuoi]